MKNSLLEETENIELAVVIPTLDEEYTIEKILKETINSLKDFNKSYKIIVSDNSSKDNTIKIASIFKEVIINQEEKRGYGANLKSVFSKINAKYIIFFDCDGSYDPKYILDFYNKIVELDDDMIIGNRLKNSETNAMPFLHKYLGTPLLSFLIRILFNIRIFDCNCGIRIFKNSSYKKIIFTSNGMEFASELLIKFAKNNCSVSEMGIFFKKDYRNKKPHLSTWRDGWRHLRFILSSVNSIHLTYFLSLGSLFYLIIFLLSFFETDNGLPRFHTIFALLSILIFFQSTLIGILNMRLKMSIYGDLKCNLINRMLILYKQNYFMKIFIFFLLIFFIELTVLLILWINKSFGEIIYLKSMIRILLYSSLGSFFLNLDLLFESWADSTQKFNL